MSSYFIANAEVNSFKPRGLKSVSTELCTPGMGMSLWGASPLYVNPVNVFNKLTKVLAEGKVGIVRDRLKEAGVQSDEPTCLRATHRQANRNSIQDKSGK